MKWGLITYGTITPKFIKSLHTLPSEELVAIASRSHYLPARKDYPHINVYDNYEDLLSDDNVEIVYISSTHNFHYQQVRNALLAGKHVLCEKPMTTCYEDTDRLCTLAEKEDLFLMEAVWARFLPAYRKMKEVIESGDIGKIKYISAHFSFNSPWGEERRLFNKDLAGGGTYDVGIYNIALATDLLGNEPVSTTSKAIMSDTGVDESCLTVLQYPEALTSLYCGFQLDTDHQAVIYGERGKMIMDCHWKAKTIAVWRGSSYESYYLPFTSTGYVHEIKEVTRCIGKGRLESEIVPHRDSRAIARIIDQVLEDIHY